MSARVGIESNRRVDVSVEKASFDLLRPYIPEIAPSTELVRGYSVSGVFQDDERLEYQGYTLVNGGITQAEEDSAILQSIGPNTSNVRLSGNKCL